MSWTSPFLISCFYFASINYVRNSGKKFKMMRMLSMRFWSIVKVQKKRSVYTVELDLCNSNKKILHYIIENKATRQWLGIEVHWTNSLVPTFDYVITKWLTLNYATTSWPLDCLTLIYKLCSLFLKITKFIWERLKNYSVSFYVLFCLFLFTLSLSFRLPQYDNIMPTRL